MLTLPCRHHRKVLHQEKGVVLLLALVILVAMTLAGVALIRSVDLVNLIAGNLAFRQSATHAGDKGIEAAVSWLSNNPTLLASDNPSSGYFSAGKDATRTPGAGNTYKTWDEFWPHLTAKVTLNKDASGNTVSYVIDRMCANSGTYCTQSTVAGTAEGSGQEGGDLALTSSSATYYRITVRIEGPRSTVSYVQAIVTM